MLTGENRQKLDGILQQMTKNKESDANIRTVVNDFKSKYETPAQNSGGGLGGFVSDVFKGVTAPVVTSLARGGQAIQDVAQIGAKTLQTGSLQKGLSETKTPEWDLPYYGKITAPKSAEEIGGTALQTVSAGLGPVAGGASYMAGQAMTENKGVGEVAGQAALGGALGKVGELGFKYGGKALGAVGEKLLQPFKSSFNSEAVGAATRQGVTLPLSAQTGSKFVQALESTAKSGIFGKDLEKTVNTAREKISNTVSSMYKDIDLDKAIDTNQDALSVGNAIKKSFGDAEEVYKETRTNLYDSVMPKIKNSPAVLDDTVSTLKSIIKEKGSSRDPGAESQVNYYKKLLSNFSNAPKTSRDWVSGNKIANTFENIKQTRTTIGSKLKSFVDPIAAGDKSNLNRVYASLSNDLDATVSKYDPAHAEALKAANDYFKEGMNKFNSALGKKIANSTKPELLVDQIIKPGQITEIENFKNLTDPETFNNVKSLFTSNFLEKSVGINGEISGTKLTTQMSRYGDSTLKSVLGEDGFNKLAEIRDQSIINDVVNRSIVEGKVSTAKLSQAIKTYGEDNLKNILPKEKFDALMDSKIVSEAISRGEKMTTGSPTAEKGRILGYIAGLALKPLSVVKEILGESVLNKFLTSNFGKKYLTTGYGEIPGMSKTGKFISGIPQATRDLPKANIPGTPNILPTK